MPWTLLLDLYDTLAWTDWPAVHAGRERVAARAGVDPGCVAGGWRSTESARNLGRLGRPADELRALLAGCGGAPDAELLRDLLDLDAAAWRESLQLYPDTLPFLDRARAAGRRLALVSNCSWETRPALAAAGLAARLDATVLSCDTGLAKPDPAILRLALERAGASAGETVYVDDIPTYLDAGRALGMRTVLAARGRDRGPARDGHPVIRDLAELERMIAGWAG
jgi:putative hydrolase of the HAD superfamily